jgi:hypothetical protein
MSTVHRITPDAIADAAIRWFFWAIANLVLQ